MASRSLHGQTSLVFPWTFQFVAVCSRISDPFFSGAFCLQINCVILKLYIVRTLELYTVRAFVLNAVRDFELYFHF